MIGKTISHYKILEKLGGGGMGVVYKAEDTKLKRTVALKFLPPVYSFDKEAKQRFIQEAQSASSLDHNNICTIHEVGETDDGQLFICMNCYDGETLKNKIERGQIKTDEGLDIIVQVAAGLQKAHEKGIIHRDIKPANIFITNDGVVKILDFGLAKLSGQTMMTKMGETVGTIAYMSPEQARGELIDYRTDIWSLGVVLYEMITGQLPFKGEYEHAIVYSILNENPKQLTSLCSGVPISLEQILNKAMSKNLDDRYQHIDALCADLKSLSAVLRDISLKSEPAIQEYSRNVRVYLYAGFILLFLLFIMIGIYFIQHREQGSTEDITSIMKPVSNTETQWQSSIAVLPFTIIGTDPEQEYFSDGMTEQIITNLSQLTVLKVIARTSVMKYKGTQKSIPEIGKELKVAYILEGSVRKFGNRVRVTAQLIKTADGFHLWANHYDRELDEVFAVQDDISEKIGNSLLQALSAKEVSDIKTKRPANTEAYENFLKASYLGFRFEHVPTMENYQNAEVMFKETIEFDTNYAPSHAGLANLYNGYSYYFANSEEEKLEYLRLMEKQVAEAMKLDPTSPDVLFSKAWVHWRRNEFKERYETIKKALKINPNHVRSNLMMGYLFRNQGLIYQSFDYFNRVTKLDPVEPWSYLARGWSYWLMGKVDSAFIEYDKALQLEPHDSQALKFYLINLLMMKMSEKGDQILKRFITSSPDRDTTIFRSWLLAAQGKKDEAMQEFKKSEIGDNNDRMILNNLLGNTEEAIKYLVERNQNESNHFSISRYIHLKNHPFYDSMRKDVRFQKILKNEQEKYPFVLKYYGF